MESTAFTPLNEQASTVLEPRQTQPKLPLLPSVAQPSPQSVMHRSAQRNAKHDEIEKSQKRGVNEVPRAPRSLQQHQATKNSKTHKIQLNKKKKNKRTRAVAASATTRTLTRIRSFTFLLMCTENLLADWTVAQRCPGGADCSTGDVSTWNVAKVTSLEYTFHYASSFNQAISEWDVATVTSLESTFHYASSFNQAISEWDVATSHSEIAWLKLLA